MPLILDINDVDDIRELYYSHYRYEDIINKYKSKGLSNYYLKQLIKEFNMVNRAKKCITDLKKKYNENSLKEEDIEVVFIDDKKQTIKEDLKKQIRDKLQKSKSLREN